MSEDEEKKPHLTHANADPDPVTPKSVPHVGVFDADGVIRVAERISEELRVPFIFGGRQLFVTASIGISLYPDHGDDEQTLMKNADTAMYLAKEQGKNTFEFYSHGAKTQSIERLALEAALRTALARNEFVLQYQAKLDLQTNRISGVEALLRWHHPEMGTVAPNQFTPAAKSNSRTYSRAVVSRGQKKAWRSDG
jgi:predicted signal transduction protein with EAL and GGDEF domain